MEMQADEASSDAAVVLEGGSNRLLHEGLRRRATLVVEPDLEAGTYGDRGEERKDGKCRSGEEGETLHVGTNGACSSCWFFWLPKPLGVMGDYIAYNKGCMGKLFPTFPYEMDSWVDDLSNNNVKEVHPSGAPLP